MTRFTTFVNLPAYEFQRDRRKTFEPSVCSFYFPPFSFARKKSTAARLKGYVCYRVFRKIERRVYFSTRGSRSPKAAGRAGREKGSGEPSLSICNDVYCSDINRSGRVVSIGSFSPFSSLSSFPTSLSICLYRVRCEKGIFAALFASGEYMHKRAVRTHAHKQREREREGESEGKREGGKEDGQFE